MVKYDFIYTIFTLAAVDVCASTMKSKAGKPEKGVYLSAKGGVSFGSEFNTLKVDGSTALASIRGGSLDASNSEDKGLFVRNDGSAYVCKADLIKGGTDSSSTLPGDGLPGVLLSDRFNDPAGDNPKTYVVNARIEGGNADVATPGAFGGRGLELNRGRADIVSKKSFIVGGFNYDGTSRGIAIGVGNSGNLYVYEGHIGDTMTGFSMNNFGYASIYGGNWMGSWLIGGPTNVYDNLVHDNDKLTGTLCDGNEIDIQVQFQGGTLNLVQNCNDYEYVTSMLPYPEC